MEDSIISDGKELLVLRQGDERILKQILRACENDEVVSNYERSYVRKLAEKHLRKPEPSTAGGAEAAVPDVTIPAAASTAPAETIVLEKPPEPAKQSTKNRKIFAGVGAVIAVAIAVTVLMSGPVEKPDTDLPDPPPVAGPDLLIRTDQPSYQRGDIISISGSSPDSGTINIAIANHNNQQVWSDSVAVRGSGEYSSLAIAGGDGWEESGVFAIIARSGSESASSTFSFAG